MKKEIKALLKRINSEIVLLIIEKANMVLTKPKNLTDETERELINKELWDIEQNIRELKAQRRALTSLIGTL